MPFNDDIRLLADLKQQISQKMILLCNTSPRCHYDMEGGGVPKFQK